MVGKALCFLGYLMFRVFLETDNPYQEKIESAKNPKHNTNPNCGIPEMFCLRRLSRPVRVQGSGFRFQEDDAAACSHFLPFCSGSRVGCKRRAAANDRGYNARIRIRLGIGLGIRAISNQRLGFGV
jgi:hypothetical protein